MRYLFLFFITCTTISGFTQDKAGQLDSLFNKLYNSGAFNGNVLVAEKGKIIYEKSFGMASLAENRPLNSQSVFELASVSKQFTAMGIMILKHKGLISYEDSLRKFFPELPYYGITIRQMLNHCSGLPDYMGLFAQNWDSTKIATNADVISLLAIHKPAILFAPGEKFEYSNTGYALLASVIEKVSGKKFGAFLSDEIFRPLKMKNTRVYSRRFDNKSIENYAYGYVRKTGNEFVLPDDHTEYRSMVYALDGIKGDGTVNATTGDLLLWDRALYGNKLVSSDDWNEAMKRPVMKNGKKSYYGFGWMLDSTETFGSYMNHSGGWPGYRTFIERHTDHDKTFIILTNMEKGNIPVTAVRSILYNLKTTAPAGNNRLSTDSLKQYTGRYQLAPEFIITVWVENEQLMGQATGQQAFVLSPDKTDWFRIKIVDASIRFTRNADGKVNSLVLYQNGQEVPGEKLE